MGSTSLRVGEDQVVGNVALAEALAVEGNAELLAIEGFRLSYGKRLHILWEDEPASDLTLRIVVSVEQKDGNIGLGGEPFRIRPHDPRWILAQRTLG